MSNRTVKLEELASKFVLVTIQSELIAQTILQNPLEGTVGLDMKEAVTQAKRVLTLPLDLLYEEIIDTLGTLELSNELQGELEELGLESITSKEEWLDMTADLVKEIKEEIL